MKGFEVVSRDAWITHDGLYRYWLKRVLRPVDSAIVLAGRVVFVMLNPSTADAKIDDATIRRCMGFAFAWRFRELMVVNLFGWRATDPDELLAAADPAGPENRRAILSVCRGGTLHVAAWGHIAGRLSGTAEEVAGVLKEKGYNLKCLGVTKDGQPRHPLMLKKSAKPVDWPIAS